MNRLSKLLVLFSTLNSFSKFLLFFMFTNFSLAQDQRGFLEGLDDNSVNLQACLCENDADGAIGTLDLQSTDVDSSVLYINDLQVLSRLENGTQFVGENNSGINFSFGRVLAAMIGLSSIETQEQQNTFNTFVNNFLRRIDTDLPSGANLGNESNDFVARPTFTNSLGWFPDENGNFSLESIPVTLIAAVYRPDLADGTSAGEGRLIYDLDNAIGRIIIEFKLPTVNSISPIAGQVDSFISTTEWAAMFGKLKCLDNLGNLPEHRQQYLDQLRNIFSRIAISRYDENHFECKSALGQLRINEFTAGLGIANQWHLYEFQMQGCQLQRHRMADTPLDHRYERASEGVRITNPSNISQAFITPIDPGLQTEDTFMIALELAKEGFPFMPDKLAFQNTHFTATNSWMKTLVGNHPLFPNNQNTLYKTHLFGSDEIDSEWQETARSISINTCVSCHSRGPQAVGPAGGAGGVFFFHSGTSLQNNSPAAFLTTNNGTGEGDFVQRTDRMLAFLGMSGNVDESRSAGLCNPNIICNFDYITLGSSEGNIDDADLLHFQQVLNLEDVDALPGFVYDLNGDSEINAVDLNLLTQFVNGNQSAGETFINPSCDIIQPSFTSDDDNDDGNNDDEELDPTTMTPCEKMMAFGDVAGDIISTSPITYESDPNGVIDHADAVELLQMAISGNFTNDLRFDFNGDGEFNFSDLQFSSDFTNGHIDCDTEEPDPTNMNACEKIIAFGDVAGDVTSLSPLEYNLEPLNGVIDIADNTQMIHMILSGDFTNDIRFDFNGDGVFNFQDLAFVSNFVNGHIDCGDAITLGMHLFHSVNGSSVQCIRDNNALKNKNQNCGSPLLEFQRKLLEGIKKSKSEKLKTNTKGFLSKEEKK